MTQLCTCFFMLAFNSGDFPHQKFCSLLRPIGFRLSSEGIGLSEKFYFYKLFQWINVTLSIIRSLPLKTTKGLKFPQV